MNVFGIPALPGTPLITRPRLIHALESDCIVCVLAAPAGWGKTTILSEWARSRTHAVAWLTLDREHDDAERFLRALATTIRDGLPVLREVDDIVDDGRPVAARAAALARAIVDVDTGLVLDDLHNVAGRVGEIASSFMKALPTSARLRIGSRVRPAFVEARDVVHGVVVEITRDQLALTGEEIRRVLGEPGEDTDPATIDRVLGATEGWPAAVRALRLLVDRTGGIARALSVLQGDAGGLSEYFAHEVLRGLDADDVRVLSALSVLDSVTRSSCRAVTRDARAWRRLTALVRSGMFVTAHGGGELRIHALLRDELRRRIREQSPAHAARLELRAARWLARSGRTEAAIDHLLEALDLAHGAGVTSPGIGDRAASLLEESAGTVLMRGGRAWFLERARRIPSAIVSGRPYLSRLIAWLERDARAVQPEIRDGSPRAAEARCLDGAIRVNHAIGIMSNGDMAEAAMSARAFLPPDDGFLRSIVVSVLQVAYRFGGDPDVARAAIEETSWLARSSTRPVECVQARAMLGVLHMMQGRLHAAREALEHGLDLARHALDPGAPQVAMCHQFLGYVLYEWNEIEAAIARLETAAAIARPLDHDGVLTGALRVLAMARLRSGESAAAAAAMTELETRVLSPSASPRNREWMDGVRAAFTLAAGSTEGLSEWIVRWRYDARALARAPLGQLHARFQEFFVMAEALIVLGRSREAIPLVRALGAAAASGDRLPFRVLAFALEAAALESIGETAVAESALVSALQLAAPEEIVRVIADGPAILAGVLGRVRTDDRHAPFVEKVRAAAGAPADAEALTAREREVLALVARGLSNKAIARDLGLSLATVKTHLNHIFGKLHASSRTHAVARAREHGYLRGSRRP